MSTARKVNVPLEKGQVELSLVAGRAADERTVVSTRKADQVKSGDLVALASQLQNARELVKGRAFDRLHDIAQQMEQLQEMARRVLEDAQRDEDLHATACNLQKVPGKVYHLYQRQDGQRYMSLLSPQEWGTPEKWSEFSGSFRLEADRSWTPVQDIANKERKFAAFEQLLSARPEKLAIGASITDK